MFLHLQQVPEMIISLICAARYDVSKLPADMLDVLRKHVRCVLLEKFGAATKAWCTTTQPDNVMAGLKVKKGSLTCTKIKTFLFGGDIFTRSVECR